jgi:hypothetical protein
LVLVCVVRGAQVVGGEQLLPKQKYFWNLPIVGAKNLFPAYSAEILKVYVKKKFVK